MMVLALVTCERSFLKARHSLRNGLPAGQRYSSASSFQWKSLLEKTVVLALGFVPYRHMRLDVFLLHHPGQHRSGTVSGIANEALRLDVELRFDPFDHRLGALDFCGSMSRCGLHIHDDAVFGIDQIVRGIGEERWAAWSSGPAGLRISQRQALR